MATGQAGAAVAALRTAQSRNAGGWFVAGASADVGRKESVTCTIASREVVFWRNSAGDLVAGPGACPHLGALLVTAAHAQEWPTRAVTLVVPFAAGGPVDTAARIVAARLSENLGQ